MTRGEKDGLIFLLLGSLVFVILGMLGTDSMGDYRSLYYGARCLLEHRDPYNKSVLLELYQEDAGNRAMPDPIVHGAERMISTYVNFPTAFLLTLPFSIFSWQTSHYLWMVLIDTSLLFAAGMVWRFEGNVSPVVAGSLSGLVLLSSISVPAFGNVSAIVVTLCVIASCCLLRDRYVAVGIFCLACGLILKPQDAGFVWAFFLLAGGLQRKRALQTLAVFVLLSLPGVLLTTAVAPHWPWEMLANQAESTLAGNFNDPRPNAASGTTGLMFVNLQSVFSVFTRDPRLYNLATALACAPLFLAWIYATIHRPFTPQRAWLALAAIAPLTLLPVYHRPHDAKLLLLVIPACVQLWAQRSRLRWAAVALTSACILLTAEFSATHLGHLPRDLHIPFDTFADQLLIVLLGQPAPIFLLAAASFFGWLYLRSARDLPQTAKAA
jgi:hypothetical protein